MFVKNVQIYNSCFAGNYKQIYAKENDSTKYLNNVVDILDRTGVSLPYS
jgi:elongation factor P hydroxylase